MSNQASTISGIPVYEALVTGENTGMVRVSLVDDPAVMTNWLKFRKEGDDVTAQSYSIADAERRIVRGVVMRADFPIYRREVDKATGRVTEYYVIYHPDTIRTMAEKYLAESRQNKVDTMHEGAEVDGVQMVQWFIKDTSAGVAPSGFAEDIADGSLFAEYHIINDEVWEQVKDGTFRGFSLEGFFALVPETEQRTIDQIVDELAGQFHITDMSKIERIKELLRAENARQEQEAHDAPATIERPEKFGAVSTDRGALEWDGEDDLKAGDRVYTVDEDGNRTDAPDGDYTVDEGKIIVVADGTVSEIKEKEAKPEGKEEEVSAARQRFDRIRVAMSESYEELTRKIAAAVLAERGEGDWYIQECGDDYAIVTVWDGEEYKYYRYTITWNGDDATAADPQEVVSTFVPVGAEQQQSEAEEELRNQLNDANATIATLTAELEAARQKPAALPAHEALKVLRQKAGRTGDRGADRLSQLVHASRKVEDDD